jgi:hypothetical protein
MAKPMSRFSATAAAGRARRRIERIADPGLAGFSTFGFSVADSGPIRESIARLHEARRGAFRARLGWIGQSNA